MTESAPSPSTARRSTKRFTLACLFVVLVGALAWGANWWTHPSVLGDSTSMHASLHTRPVAEARSYVGITLPDVRGNGDETLRFDSAVAHLATDSAASKVFLAICTTQKGSDPIGFLTDQDSRFADSCSAIRRIKEGTTLRWAEGAPPKEYVLLVIEPTRAGVTQVDKVTFRYAREWKHLHQQGTDTAHVNVTVSAS